MTIKLPSMLAFERKLEPSDALMMSGIWNDIASTNDTDSWQPITPKSRTLRGTKSQFAKDKREEANISEGDDAYLPLDKDTLKVGFTLRIIGNIGEPFGCNDPDFEKKIKEKVGEHKTKGLKELAHRYAHNIASGRFLWRNRVCAEDICIQAQINNGETLSFKAGEFDLNDFDAQRDNDNLEKLADAIYTGLNGINDFVLISINAYVLLGKGQHVFPSQEMNMGEKKKVLFTLDSCAALHSVKVGNAIRTIDDWYENAEFPIAIEPFGSVTQRGQAYRTKSNTHLYDLMLAWVNEKDISAEQKNFVLANLIRGGVFGGKAES